MNMRYFWTISKQDDKTTDVALHPGREISVIILQNIILQLYTRIYDQHIYICQIHLDIYSAVSHHTYCKGVLKPPHVVSYIHTFYRTEVWYLCTIRTIVTQHNWVRTIYHHKLSVTYFDRKTVICPLAESIPSFIYILLIFHISTVQ